MFSGSGVRHPRSAVSCAATCAVMIRKNRYEADLAHARARNGARRLRRTHRAPDPDLRAAVAQLLKHRWSHE